MSLLLERGVAAAERIAALLRYDIRKALDPLNPKDFLLITERLTRRIDRAVEGEEALAMRAALDTLDVAWGSMTPPQVDKIVNTANAILRKRVANIPARLDAALAIDGPWLTEATRAAAIQTFDLSISSDLAARDIAAEKIMRKSTTNFVRDELGNRCDVLSERARGIVQRGMAGGLSSTDISENLLDGLGDRVSKGGGYWRVVANSFANGARTVSQFGAMRDAEIEQWIFESVLDEATSDICRFYHGRIFSMGTANKHIDRITKLKDPEQITELSPWVRSGVDDEGQDILYVKKGDKNVRIANVDRSGIGSKDDQGAFSKAKSSAGLEKLGAIMPPLHGCCRSTVVPA